jgi:hypothetical protein
VAEGFDLDEPVIFMGIRADEFSPSSKVLSWGWSSCFSYVRFTQSCRQRRSHRWSEMDSTCPSTIAFLAAGDFPTGITVWRRRRPPIMVVVLIKCRHRLEDFGTNHEGFQRSQNDGEIVAPV